jgi:hypothetical protein
VTSKRATEARKPTEGDQWRTSTLTSSPQRSARRAQHRTEAATVERVDPLVMARAFELANGDARRVRVIDAHTVIIRN